MKILYNYIKYIYRGEIMTIDLSKDEVNVLLDALLQNLAFDNSANEIKDLYNKVLKETKIKGFEEI